jgi:predicted metalloprotease
MSNNWPAPQENDQPASRVGPPEGWYPDPTWPTMLRYWDGANWTHHVHTPAVTQPELELEGRPQAKAGRGIADARYGMIDTGADAPVWKRPRRRVKGSSYAYISLLVSVLVVSSVVAFQAGKQSYADVIAGSVESGSSWETPADFGDGAVVVPADPQAPSDTTGADSSGQTAGNAVSVDAVDSTRPYAEAFSYMQSDIASWWAQEFPRVFNKPLVPLRDGVHYSNGIEIPGLSTLALECEVTPASIAGNAFYAGCSDGIYYDDEQLMPDTYEQYGDLALGLILAHEWGHAVQNRTSFPENIVTSETQADCYAGAWLASFRAGPGWGPDAEESLPWTLLAMANFADSTDVSQAATYGVSENSHGSMIDRLGAMTEGMYSGVEACANYLTTPPTVVQFPWDLSTEQGQAELATGGDLSGEEIVQLVINNIDPYWRSRAGDGAALMPALENVEDPGAECPIRAGSVGFSYCDSKNIFVTGTPSTALPLEPKGDMSYAISFSLAYADAYKAATGSNTHRACLAGEWFRFLLDDKDSQFSASPPDVDEATWMILAADWAEVLAGRRFEPTHVIEFRTGVLSGCGEPYTEPVLSP